MTAIILLPGMDGTGRMFAEFAASLEGNLRPVVISYPSDKTLSYRELADFAQAFLPTNEPFILLGESFSGPVAISLAASEPAGLIGLVLCCTFTRNPLPFLRFLKDLTGILPINARIAALGMPLLFGRFSTVERRTALQQALQSVPVTTLRTRMRAVSEVDVSKELQKVNVPILYLQASLDRVVPKSAASYMQSLVSNIDIIKIRGPHLLLQAMPKEAARIVEEFATRLSAAFNSPLHTDAKRACEL